MWEESKHPRADDGRFTSKNGTPAEHKRLREKGIISREEEKELNNKVKSKSIKAETGYTITATKDEINKYNKEYLKENKQLSSQIDKVLNGTYKDTHITLCNETPKVLQDLGIPNYPMLITTKHTYLTINKSGKYKGSKNHYHNLGKSLFEKIPRYLQMPLLVFQQDKEDIVAVINLVDKDKKPIIVPIHINGKGKQNFIMIDSNIIKSAYGKDNYKNYIKKNVTKDNILFFNNKKIRDLNHE